MAPAVEPSPARCPHDLPVRLPREAVPGVRFDMVPATPQVLVICVSGTRTVVVPPQLTRIVHALNHLDRVPPGTAYACPADLGPLFALFFDYPDGSRLLVEVSSSGCRFVFNGRISARVDRGVLRSLQILTHT